MAYTLSQAQSGLGVLLQVNIGNPSPASYTTVGEVVSVDMGQTNEFDDTTNLQSLAREVLATIMNPGKMNFEFNRVSTDAGQVACNNSWFNRSRLQYRVLFPPNGQAGQTTAGDSYVFAAYVEKYTPMIRGEKKVTGGGVLQCSGFIGYTQGS